MSEELTLEEKMNVIYDVACSRIDCGVNPLEGMKPGSLGEQCGQLALDTYGKLTPEQRKCVRAGLASRPATPEERGE